MHRKNIFRLAALFSLMAAAYGTAQAQVQVDQAWTRATVPQQQATGIFMQLTSDQDRKLLRAQSPAAKTTEIHEMTRENDVMRMRQVDAVSLPAHKTVELGPGGYHIMLIGLTQQIKVGDAIPVTLTFEKADGAKETQQVQATARALNATTTEGHSAHEMPGVPGAHGMHGAHGTAEQPTAH